MNWLSCLKWDPCEMQERRAKGVFRTKHPHRPTPFLNQCPTEISLSSFKLYCPAAMFKCIRTPFSSEKPYNCATFRTEEDKGNRLNLLLQFKISMCKGNMRPVPTKWETSHKNPFPRYDQVQNGILHVMVAAVFEVQNYFHLVKFLCFLLISEMFNEPYLLQFPGDLSLILWQQVSYASL